MVEQCLPLSHNYFLLKNNFFHFLINRSFSENMSFFTCTKFMILYIRKEKYTILECNNTNNQCAKGILHVNVELFLSPS